MMKFTLTILAVAAVVTAADDWSTTPSNSSSGYNSTTPGNSTTSPAYTSPAVAIPSSASQGCQSFLKDFNASPTIQSCLAPALAAAAAQPPSLTKLCDAVNSQGCSATTMRTWLTYFASNCSAELVTTPNEDVKIIYDAMYVSVPFSHAVCATTAAGDFCLNKLANDATVKAASGLNNAAQKPLSATDGTPDADVFTAASILFLGANSNMTSAELCTECTKNILTSYFSYESTTAYSGGLASSPLLGAQNTLYSAVSNTCGAAFLSGALSNAGSDPNSMGSANAKSGAITFSVANGLVALAALAGGFMAL
ncbi:hypothetical protein BU17DRAFT_67157 [Hysterangium stoloniferum]|nr:hypothetical protein BU17DRAFT_67157 [Hysterangium stoloniferum]